jgi:hypothetical protein
MNEIKNICFKACKILGIDPGNDPVETLSIYKIVPNDLPGEDILDVVIAGGLDSWAKNQNENSEDKLKNRIIEIIKLTINSGTSTNNKKIPLLKNFFHYCNSISQRDAINKEAGKIAEQAWYGELARKRLKDRTKKMFSKTPDIGKFNEVSIKIMKIWGFSQEDINALRYFVCQAKNETHNPSMNKEIYLWSNKKRTGKTTLAKTIVCILNGEKSIENAGFYESFLAKEMQYNPHELPKSSFCNAVYLDEAIPKDSVRMYGQMKQMLTSNSCNFNQKYGSISTIPCRRNYIFTSNEDISDFVQDEKERRFYAINMQKMPEQISFKEIYDIWTDFCVNATPPMDSWQDWYNSFKDVEGIRAKDKDYFVTAIKSDNLLSDIIEGIRKYYVSPPLFHNHLIKGKITRDEKKAINAAIVELFGEPYTQNRWKKSHVLDVLGNDEEDEVFINPEVDGKFNNDSKDLPF